MEVEFLDASDRVKWLALRQQDLTASDIAAVCGMDDFRTPIRVWAEKSGLIESEPESNAMKRGRHFEAAAVSWLIEDRPAWEIRRSTVYLRAPGLRLGATPDVVAVDPERKGIGNVQIKVVSRRIFNEKWRGGADEEDIDAPIRAPIGYQLQTIQECKLAGASWGCLAALVVSEFGADLHVVPVDIHEGAWQRIQDEASYFWRCVDAGRMPDLDPARDAATIAALYPRETRPDPLDLKADNALPALLRERDDLKARMDADKERVGEIETTLKARIGEHAAAITADNRTVTWKLQERKGFTVAPSSSRVLRVGKPKGE